MDGQTVPKDKPYTLKGIKGGTFYPMYPHDTSLPPEESINCHCLSEPITNDLGLSLEERQKLQQEIIDNDDGEWMKELDAKNKAKAGIEEYDALKEFEGKTRAQQVKYIGGKSKMALYDAGLVNSEDMLKTVKNSTLKELSENGIFTVKSTVVNHSVMGTYKQASKPYPNGRMVSGGHTQAAMVECTLKGIDYEVTGTFSNGVRIGNVPSSETRKKRTGNGQAWFPQNWDEDKVRTAGTAIANDGQDLVDGYHKTGVYDGVAVRVLVDDGEITTICPDLDQNLYVEGVEKID
jgi:hypothetical protein